MELKLLRHPSKGNATIGELYVDGIFECYILEDIVRDGPKVYGKTAIPAGRYPIRISRSNRYSRRAGKDIFLPEIINVPGFTGIRIHPGNYPKDTDGCLLPGTSVARDRQAVLKSKLAFNKLFDKLRLAYYGGERIDITIQPKLESKMLEYLSGKKTYLVAAAGILAALAALAAGEIDVVGFSAAVLNALGVASLRAGVAKAGG